MKLDPTELWVLEYRHNNVVVFDDIDEIYTSKEEAESAADHNNPIGTSEYQYEVMTLSDRIWNIKDARYEKGRFRGQQDARDY